jgi:KipI family sensor histidine kinase inhibitor
VIIRSASDRSLLVSFGGDISVETHRLVLRLTRELVGLRSIRNVHPAYSSLLVEFDPRLHGRHEIEALIRAQWECGRESPEPPARTVELPVIYGGECGPDLEDVARHAGLDPARVIELHAAAEYLVYFLGFATAFVYLGGLPPELATPRLAAPRRQVPAGSIGIAGPQAGIYPLASPGGWRLIGRTPRRLFDPQGSPPPLLRMGDRIRFVPVREAGF